MVGGGWLPSDGCPVYRLMLDSSMSLSLVACCRSCSVLTVPPVRVGGGKPVVGLVTSLLLVAPQGRIGVVLF